MTLNLCPEAWDLLNVDVTLNGSLMQSTANIVRSDLRIIMKDNSRLAGVEAVQCRIL